jgi:hypothetical protein
MPAPYLEELNRSSKKQPGESQKEYVQWQRGPLTNISLDEMKGWIDTCIANDNIWLVLVFHGIDGIGWEPKTGKELEEYFKYINDREDKVWVATFANVTKYIRARKNTTIESNMIGKSIEVKISSTLDHNIYDVPITLKTYIPKTWKSISINKDHFIDDIKTDTIGNYITYPVSINENTILLKEKL